ncbi:leucine-rich repeat protein [uncultured Ruminococcus sp.]|uniref:leucine-rich repeat protein n=1 Tax=uncultured Ruminococcus sp. TaxID=165186 RepID=UPI0025E96FEB|nr:leucine-rich repeat protein [uncultured Ruminococcus sp.]
MNCKRIVAALMCAVVSLGTTALSLRVPVTLSAEAATIVDSGNYGENIRWELDSDGTLVVRGMGDMGDVGPVKNTPWVKEKDLIKKVVISNGITRVGDQNFNSCKNLVSVTLPDTLKTIGFVAFSECSALTSIVIPASVTVVEHEAFKSCSNAEITISSTATKIEGGAFSGTKWEEEQLEKSPFVVINGVLLAARIDTEKIVIPDGVECIGRRCFQGWGYWSVTEVVIPDSVKIIESRVFEGFRSLKSVTIPESVEKIEPSAFQSCNSLEKVCILNPECDINDMNSTFTNGASYAYTGIIKGYRGSTAEAYANKYDRIFVPVDSDMGDVNFDGNVNAVDASMVLAYYAMISTNQDGGYNEEQMLAADVNHDGDINAVDASSILAYYAYVSTTKETPMSMEEYTKKN